jgi:stage III sporulation protein SpoIIIAA
MEKRVVIIDTSNEIAGDSDIPHSGWSRQTDKNRTTTSSNDRGG